MKKFTKEVILVLGMLLIIIFISACSAGSSNRNAVGKYFRKDSTTEYIELKADNKFKLIQNELLYTGEYKIDNKEITLTFSKGGNDKGTINEDTIIDSENIEWKK